MSTQPSRWFETPAAPEPQHAQQQPLTMRQRDQILGLRTLAELIARDERISDALDRTLAGISGTLPGDGRQADLLHFAETAEAAGAKVSVNRVGPLQDGSYRALAFAEWSEHVSLSLLCAVPPPESEATP